MLEYDRKVGFACKQGLTQEHPGANLSLILKFEEVGYFSQVQGNVADECGASDAHPVVWPAGGCH